MMIMRAGALALLVGAANAQDPAGCGSAMALQGKTGCDAECAGLAYVEAEGICTGCMMDGTTITSENVDSLTPAAELCSGHDDQSGDGDGHSPSPCDMCHGTCSDADDADACHRGCENTACAPTTASLEEDCPSQMAACTGDPSGQCQTALDDMLAAYATGARASPGTSDLFTDVALCMFTKGDPNCATETRDCFLDGDCLLQMHAMETAPPEPGNGLLEGETCFSRFDRLPLLANQKKYLLSAMMSCFMHAPGEPCGASEHACWLDDGCRPLMWPEPPDCGHDDAACMAAWEADLETQINALPDSTLFRTMEACRNEHDDHSRDEEEGPPEW